jgi:broad specificity phosphatase PhoE
MRATQICLLRHGESEGNAARRFGGHGPTPLTELGRAQAQATARALAAEGGLVAIITSDLARAVETAEPIAEATGVKLEITPALRERSVGIFTGLTFEEAEARYPEHYAALVRRDPLSCPPEGELLSDCRARAAAVLDAAVDRASGGRALLVSHAHTINLLLKHVLQIADTIEPPVYFQTDNCALHRLERSDGGMWRVRALNDRRHLPTI